MPPPSLATLAQDVLARHDEAEQAKQEQLDQAFNLELATSARADGDSRHELATMALDEYVEGIFPRNLEAAKGEIKAEETRLARLGDQLELVEQALKKDPESPDAQRQQLTLKAAIEAGELTLKNARRRRLTLESYEKVKGVTQLQADITRALAARKTQEAEVLLQTERVDRSKRRADRAALSEEEERAVTRLDEAFQAEERWRAALDAGKADHPTAEEAARTKLDEATTAWEAAKSKRELLHAADARRQIHKAAEAIRGRKPALRQAR